MTEYINLVQTAQEIGITTTSLYKIINHEDPSKRLEPVNRSTHRGDGGYRFRLRDVLEFKQNYVKSDLTSVEAAKRLGRSATYVHKLIKDGKIPFYEEEYRGKRTYFIKEEELERYMREYPDAGKTETIYDKRTGLFLYQPFERDGVLARIVELKRINNRKIEAVLRTYQDELLAYDEAMAQGWQPSLTIAERKPINGYGYARFEFPTPKSVDSIIFAIIEALFQHAGPANLKLTNEDGRLVAEVRKCVLDGVMPATHPDLIDKLKLFLKSGEIIPKYDGTLIDTGLLPVTLYLSEEKRRELTRKAKERNMTLQEWIMSRID
ncbi:helix-turn-helix domain-containing protein [Paenibacillus xylaniclasticus]|uniref:helix-turn-helix domain-containing protein n=1 Tax=Paenibacillus xylaniclasticus TaxID=588083 RepID=UPI000FD71C14|nr:MULTISPECIES: helix-turn-helix domain-containing protein [Paenibacillus]GFN33017.1 hypothetical protein PCURB6_32770 [Paenibacillus curdlanolyticus]